MNRLSTEQRTRVISALVEGNSIRATVRLTGVAKNTIVKLLADLGTACADYHDMAVRNVHSKRIQCDEIWSFCYCKEANIPDRLQGQYGVGDVWTWTANACELAISYGAYRLRTIRELLKRQGDRQEAFEFMDEHPIIRSLSEYGRLARSAFAFAGETNSAGFPEPLPSASSPPPVNAEGSTPIGGYDDE